MHRFLSTVFAAGMLASCQTVPPPSQVPTVETHESMVRGINPASLAIWEVTNGAVGDSGELEEALMDGAAWLKLEDAARLLALHSRELASAPALRVGAHNDKIEGFATRAEIQAMIDADPEHFRALASDMASHADDLVAAARTHDLRQAGSLADNLSERCAACHSRYWEKPSA